MPINKGGENSPNHDLKEQVKPGRIGGNQPAAQLNF